MNTYAIKIGDLDTMTVEARNRRAAINKVIDSPEEVAIHQSWATSATLVRVLNPYRCEPIGKIWRVQE